MKEIHPIRAMVDGLSAAWQKERSESQMTLGKVIKILETMPEDMKIRGLGELDSYRGYYSDLAFEPTEKSRPVFEILADCRSAMGRVFQGYKGGDFMMGETTPMWVAHYGSCGKKLITINHDGTIETKNDD